MSNRIFAFRCDDDEYEALVKSFGTGKDAKNNILSLCGGGFISNSDKLDQIISLLQKRKGQKSQSSLKFKDLGIEVKPKIDLSEDKNFKYIITSWEFWKLFRVITIESGSKPTTIDKATVLAWANEIRLMVERSETTTGELRNVYLWLKKRESNQSKFWAKNIKSTSKLREKFPQLLEEINAEKPNKQENNHIYPGQVSKNTR